jgi:hypothetical protein
MRRKSTMDWILIAIAAVFFGTIAAAVLILGLW